MIKLLILHAFTTSTCCGVADKIWDYCADGHAFESRNNFLFIFQLENILRSNLNFSTTYGRLTDLKSLIGLQSVSFIWLGKKITKIFTYRRGGRLSTTCPDWLRLKSFYYGARVVRDSKGTCEHAFAKMHII